MNSGCSVQLIQGEGLSEGLHKLKSMEEITGDKQLL